MIEGMDGPLARYSIDELLDEVTSRVDSAVFITLTTDKGAGTLKSRYHGGFYACMGMARALLWNMQKDFHEDEVADDTGGFEE